MVQIGYTVVGTYPHKASEQLLKNVSTLRTESHQIFENSPHPRPQMVGKEAEMLREHGDMFRNLSKSHRNIDWSNGMGN